MEALALGEWRQGDCEFEARLGYILRTVPIKTKLNKFKTKPSPRLQSKAW
jgi:hypothetical protein